jgi:hypothetical protein
MNELVSPEIIELKSYFDPIQANLEKELLAQEGIDCYLRDIYITDMNWLYTNAVGGIKLMIKKSDLSRATEALKVFESKITAVEDFPVTCPSCGGTDVTLINPTWLQGLIFILVLAIPSPFRSRKYKCRLCKTTWKLNNNEEKMDEFKT